MRTRLPVLLATFAALVMSGAIAFVSTLVIISLVSGGIEFPG